MANHKIIILGDEQVGKKTLNKSFMDSFDDSHVTEEAGFEKFIINSFHCQIEIWRSINYDTYYQIPEEVLADMHGVILIYDIARPTTFYHLAYWMDTISHSIASNVPLVIVGNKVDERHWGYHRIDDVVGSEQGVEFIHQIADTYNREIPYFEVSAYRNRVPRMILEEMMPKICKHVMIEKIL